LLGEVAALGALGIAGDPTRRPLLTLALLAAATLGLLGAVRGAARAPLSPVALLATAALLRVLLLPLPPALSSDVWRYLWDGRVAAHRGNPYLLAPDDPRLVPLRDDLWGRVEHREVPSVYPPVALALFVVPEALPSRPALLVWKLLVSCADLAACALLLRLAGAGGWPRHRVLWYAAHPLVALEVAGMGHVEPLGVAATVLVALLLVRRRPSGAGAAAAFAGLAKLAPLLALPLWAQQARRLSPGDESRGDGARRFLLPALGLSALALLPLATTLGGPPPGLVTYALRWEFGGPLHEPLWRLLMATDTPEAVEHGLDLMKERVGMHELWNRAYPWVYPQLLSRLLLFAAAAAVVVRSALSRKAEWLDPVWGSGALFGGLLVCSPIVYPWYLLWVLPWAALLASTPWLWAAAAAPLLYLPVLLGVPAWPAPHALVWGPAAGLWLARRWRARRDP
jgi:hypothetical protein